MIAHSTIFYLLSLGAALLLLALAFIEPPSVSSTAVPILVRMTEVLFYVHSESENCAIIYTFFHNFDKCWPYAKFFYCYILQEICNKTHAIFPTTPYMCRCTTLQYIKD